MCGIVGYVGKRSAQDVLLDGLEKLEYRGYDSAGVALALDGGIRVVKSKGRLTQLRQKLAAQALAQSFCGIGHTRWATHGEPSDVNSHPHSTPRVSIVHNGIIENYGILKERLIAKGYTFESETDTEVLVKLIDSCYTGDPLRALQEALAKVRGSYALAVLFRDRPDTIFAVKRESPLIVGWGEGENFVASDIPALLKYTRRYSVLEEGDMAVCTAEGIRFYNEFAEPVQRPVLTADWDMEAAEEPLREIDDKIENMRDPSHTRILSREEFEEMFKKDFALQCEETTLVPVNLKSWMELTDTSEDVQEEITNLMKAELEGGRKTGFSPYNKDSQIMFDHRWLLLIGVKK